MIKKMLIANRGEIAVRIMRTCKEMGITTVAIYSSADEESYHVKFADEAICVGEAHASSSYLHMNNIIMAALNSGCDAIHPGFGFLSENAIFASLVEQVGLIFVGPSAHLIELMGNKVKAKQAMIDARIPIIPGSIGAVVDFEQCSKIASEIGYPLIIKAAAGGGGKGMRLVHERSELENAYHSAKQEALASFGSSEVYMERYFTQTKHVEVQIMADKHGHVVHLFERDCSFQRRHQKVIEEAPCFALTKMQRRKILNDAVKAAKAVGYDSVGTIEFLMDASGQTYFMEMNTRIQVEHPVSEMITGIDIIKVMILCAQGKPLPFTQREITMNGFSIECRINAENIRANFAPSPGTISFMHVPFGPHIRIETSMYQGATIPPYYDSMILKLIVWGQTRLEAIKRMRGALEELLIEGVHTNIEFHYLVLHQKEFIEGRYTTEYASAFIKELNTVEEFIRTT